MGGLVTRTEVSSEALPAGDSEKLAEKAERALPVPEATASGKRSPDELLYAVSVEDGERARTLHFTEETLPEEVRELIAWVDSRPEREDRIESPLH